MTAPQRESCEHCHKLVFTSQRDANEMLNNLKRNIYRGGKSVRRTSNRRIPKRPYQCPVGNGWHVTSKPRGANW